MRDGKVAGEVTGQEIRQDRIMEIIASGSEVGCHD